MTHADRAYTAPQELADIRKEFKPTLFCSVDGVEYAAHPVTGNSGDNNLCEGCAGEDNALCIQLAECVVPDQIIWLAREQ